MKISFALSQGGKSNSDDPFPDVNCPKPASSQSYVHQICVIFINGSPSYGTRSDYSYLQHRISNVEHVASHVESFNLY